jgi:hypothetical protein
MNVSTMLLPGEKSRILQSRLEELRSTNKMYCPSCAKFINLDLVDSSQSTELPCDYGTFLCTTCKTAAHDGLCEAN